MKPRDDNDLARDGELPPDPFADALPYEPAAPTEPSASLASPPSLASLALAVSSSEPWLPPLPLGRVVKPPPFPVDVVPEWMSRWAKAQAQAKQCPVDLPICLAFAVLALGAMRKFAVRIDKSWLAPLNLYVVITLRSGESKSPIFRVALAPVFHFERNESKRVKEEAKKVATQIKALAKQIEVTLRKAGAEEDPAKHEELVKKVERLQQRTEELEVRPAPQMLAEDATAEAVAQLLGGQEYGIGVFSDEGGPFAVMAGRYSNGATFEIFLKGHDGGQCRVNRKSGPPVLIAEVFISMGLTVQPHVMRDIGKQPDFRGKGLLARFMYVVPEGMVGRRKGELQPDPEQEQSVYHAKVLKLFEIPLDHDAEGNVVPRVIDVDPAATELFVAFRNRVEPQLAPGATLAFIADWGSKMRGDVMRLAGLLHVADFLAGAIPTLDAPIGVGTMGRAIKLADYFLEHAQIALDLIGTDDTVLDARHVEQWLRARGQSVITQREIHQGVRGRQTLATVDGLEVVLGLLVQHRVLRRTVAPQGPRGPGRPPGPTYAVNPAIFAVASEGASAETSIARPSPGTPMEGQP